MDKKKIGIICGAAVVLIGVVVGIVIAVNSGSEPAPEPEKTVVDEKAFEINGLKFRLDTEKEFEGIKYEISKDFREVKQDLYTHYVEYRYMQEDDTNLLFFRIFHYPDKDLDTVINEFGIENPEISDAKINNIDYVVYNEPRDDGTVHFYFTTSPNGVYAVHFASRYDIKDFETKVMKTLKF